MPTRLTAVILLAAVLLGCADSSAPDEEPVAQRPTETIDGQEEDAPANAESDAETKAMAEQLGMTVAELQMKKQMMMDAGMWPQEIAKALTMGGGPGSLFKSDVSSNVDPPEQLKDLTFIRSDADEEFKVKDYIGRKNIVLVFMRGYYGGLICPFCSTQTAQLAAQFDAFRDRDAVVLIVYPGSREHLDDFVAAATNVEREEADIAKVRWPVLLDQDLTAVNLLDIASDLAQPSTFIIDKQGNVVFAYVGDNRTDRPSVEALLEQLDAI